MSDTTTVRVGRVLRGCRSDLRGPLLLPSNGEPPRDESYGHDTLGSTLALGEDPKQNGFGVWGSAFATATHKVRLQPSDTLAIDPSAFPTSG